MGRAHGNKGIVLLREGHGNNGRDFLIREGTW